MQRPSPAMSLMQVLSRETIRLLLGSRFDIWSDMPQLNSLPSMLVGLPGGPIVQGLGVSTSQYAPHFDGMILGIYG